MTRFDPGAILKSAPSISVIAAALSCFHHIAVFQRHADAGRKAFRAAVAYRYLARHLVKAADGFACAHRLSCQAETDQHSKADDRDISESGKH